MNDTTWLFVYGTLRPGYGNYEWMKSAVVRTIRDVEAPGELYFVGRHGFERGSYPVARFAGTNDTEPGKTIKGDLLEVENGDMLMRTHNMEVGAGYTGIELQFRIGPELIQAVAYDWQREETGAPIPSGDYREEMDAHYDEEVEA